MSEGENWNYGGELHAVDKDVDAIWYMMVYT